MGGNAGIRTADQLQRTASRQDEIEGLDRVRPVVLEDRLGVAAGLDTRSRHRSAMMTTGARSPVGGPMRC